MADTVVPILHSIYGRLVGTDKDGYIVGEKGAKHAINAATSATTATALPFGGVITLSTGDDTWNLDAPVPGVEVIIARLSTSTGTTGTVTLASGTILSSTQAAATTITFTGAGHAHLVGVSTAVAVCLNKGSTLSGIVLS